MKSAVRWAVGEKLLKKVDNPFDEITLPREKEKRRRPLATPERYAALKRGARRLPKLRGLETLLDVAWSTGRRIGAIVGLRWQDICFEKSTTFVNVVAVRRRASKKRRAPPFRREQKKFNTLCHHQGNWKV